MKKLTNIFYCTLVLALGCEQVLLVEEHTELDVSIVEPQENSLLALSSAVQVEVKASAKEATITRLSIAVIAADCAATASCSRLDLKRSAKQITKGKASFCITTHLAPEEVCPEETARLDVSGLRHGQQLRLLATAVAKKTLSHTKSSGEIMLTLVDDFPPEVFIDTAISDEDGRYGPGDRIAVAIRVVDEQSGVATVKVNTAGLGSYADKVEDWDFPPGVPVVERSTVIAVPSDFLCPGNFSLSLSVSDTAEPANSTTVDVGTGCVGVCSDKTAPRFSNIFLNHPGLERWPPHVRAGETLTYSFGVDDDLFLDGDPTVELIRERQLPGNNTTKREVVATFNDFSVDGKGDEVPGANYSFSYTIGGHEPAASYLVQVSAMDSNCNVGLAERPVIVDYTPAPTNLRVGSGGRGTTFISLDWDLVTSVTPNLHLLQQIHGGVPDPEGYTEVLPSPQYPPYIHSGLTPATRFAYRLVAESPTVPGLFAEHQPLPSVCTMPAGPNLQLMSQTQNALTFTTGSGENPETTPLLAELCRGTVCGVPGACQPVEDSCSPLSAPVPADLTVGDLSAGECYAVVLRAQGCDSDIESTAVCALTLPALGAPSWIAVSERTPSTVTFSWQSMVTSVEDPVVAYEVADANDLPLATVPQPTAAQTPQYTVTGLVPGQATTVKVRALRQSGGVGIFTPEYTGHAMAVTPPPVTGIALSSDSLELSLRPGANGNFCSTQYRLTDQVQARHINTLGQLTAEEVFAPLGSLCDPAFASTIVIGALSPDSDHVFSLIARNGDSVLTEPSTGSELMVTLATVPPVPTLISAADDHMVIRIYGGSNPSRTTYAIAVGPEFVSQTNGALATAAEFATLAQWQPDNELWIGGLSPDTTYDLMVLARNAALVPSAASTAITVWTPPAVVQNLAVFATGSTSLRIEFTRGSNPAATSYAVERTQPDNAQVYQGQDTSVDQTQLQPDTRYSYRVQAKGNGPQPQLTSDWTESASAVTEPETPAQPLVSDIDTDSFSLSVNSSDPNPTTSQVGFTLNDQYVLADGSLSQITPDAAAFTDKDSRGTITINNLEVATAYTVRAVVWGLNGELVSSAPLVIATNPAQPGALSTSQGPVATTQIELAWGLGGNPQGTTFIVEKRPFGGGAFQQLTTLTDTSLVDGAPPLSALTPGAKYEYRVYAVANGVSSAPTATVADTTYVDVPGTPLVTLPASNLVTELDVSIVGDANDSSVLYAIPVQQGASTLYVQADQSLGPAVFSQSRQDWGAITIWGLSANTLYSLTALVTNVDSDPGRSSPADQIYTAATAPASLNATFLQSRVNLSWPASLASGYRLYRGANCSSLAQIYQGAALSHADDTAVPGSSYCYQVHGLNGDTPVEESLTSAVASGATYSITPMPATSVVITNAATGQASATSDDPITTLSPYVSATHHDTVEPVTATQMRIEVETQGGTSVYDETHTITAVSPEARSQDTQIPLIVSPLDFTPQVGFAVGDAPGTDYMFFSTGATSPQYQLLDLATNRWWPLPLPPTWGHLAPGAGSSLTYLAQTNTLYALPAGGSGYGTYYNYSSSTWNYLNFTTCGTAGANSAIAAAEIGNVVHLFIYPGTGTNIWVWKNGYLLTCNALVTPWAGRLGADLAIADGSLFFSRGTSRQLSAIDLTGYTPTANTPMEPLTSPPLPVGHGGIVGGSGSELYMLTTSNPTELYRYDFTGGLPATGTYTHMGTLPQQIGETYATPRMAYSDTWGEVFVASGEDDNIWYHKDGSMTGAAALGNAVISRDTNSYRYRVTFGDSGGLGEPSAWQTFVTDEP